MMRNTQMLAFDPIPAHRQLAALLTKVVLDALSCLTTWLEDSLV